jgi:hypothetical protein
MGPNVSGSSGHFYPIFACYQRRAFSRRSPTIFSTSARRLSSALLSIVHDAKLKRLYHDHHEFFWVEGFTRRIPSHKQSFFGGRWTREFLSLGSIVPVPSVDDSAKGIDKTR